MWKTSSFFERWKRCSENTFRGATQKDGPTSGEITAPLGPSLPSTRQELETEAGDGGLILGTARLATREHGLVFGLGGWI